VNPAQLELRAEIFRSFAETGAPPELPDSPDLRALEERHVVVLDEDARIVMAHPFAAHRTGTRVDAEGRTWWGNCAWDGFGIVHALTLTDATVTAQGIAVHTTNGLPGDTDAVFDVAVPAAHWWDDIGHT
jgi:alkylmercury lyase-like protein